MKSQKIGVLKEPPWKQAFAYTEGSMHKRHKTGGQDFGDWTWGETPHPYLIVSISDGAGSSLFAKESALIVTKISLEVLESFVKKDLFPGKGRRNYFTKKLGGILVQKIQEGLHRKCKEKGSALKDFCATLISVVVIPRGIFVFQVGDSFCVIRDPGREEYKLVLPLQRGNFVNETNFVSQAEAAFRMATFTQEILPEFLALSTDGLEPVSLSLPDSKPFPPFFASLEAFLKKEESPEVKDEQLKKFLDSDRMNRRTPDDKALFMAAVSQEIFGYTEGTKIPKKRAKQS